MRRPQASWPRRVCPGARLPDCKHPGFTAARASRPGHSRERSRGGRQSRGRVAAAATSLTNMAAADANAACPGRAPSHRRGSASRPAPLALINTQQQAKFAAGGRPSPRPPPSSQLPEGTRRPRCARRGTAGRRCTGRVGRKFAAAPAG